MWYRYSSPVAELAERFCQFPGSLRRLVAVAGNIELVAHLSAAALCADTEDKQGEILEVLGKTLNISKFPSLSLLDDVARVWRGAQ